MTNAQKRKFPLSLDLQFFAEDPPPTDPPAEPEPPTDDPAPAKVEFTAEQQAELDRIIKERLARQAKKYEEEKAAAQAEAERKKLEENEEYRKLYEETKAELDRIRVDALKTRLLAEAGYTADQITRVSKYVTGDDEEGIRASIDEVKADIPPKTVIDPNPGNGKKPEPKPTDAAAEAKARLERLKKAGKVRL